MSPTLKHFRKMQVAYLVLIFSLIPAVVIYEQVKNSVESRNRLRFERLVQDQCALLEQRMPRFVEVMKGVRGLIVANPSLGQQEWNDYIAAIDMSAGHDGLRELGFIQKLSHGESDAKGFSKDPSSSKGFENYFSTVLSYDLDSSKGNISVRDHWLDPTRRACMERAGETGVCQSTEKLSLADPRSTGVGVTGFGLYLPAYFKGIDAGAKPMLKGFVYADFDCRKLFNSVFGNGPNPLVGCAIYASERVNPDQLIFGDPEKMKQMMSTAEARTKTVSVKLFDHPWTLYFTTLPEFELESQHYLPNLALVCWLVLSLLLFAITYGEIKGLSRAEMTAEELRRSEAELSAEKERLAVTLYSIGDGVITTDTEAKVVSINKAAEKLTGWPDAEAKGRPLTELLQLLNQSTREKTTCTLQSVLTSGVPQSNNSPLYLVQRNGTERAVSESAAPVRTRNGKLIGAVVVIRDITERQKSEAELLKESKLESVGLLAGGIAHDFNNILQGIIGNLSLAKMNSHNTEKMLERLSGVERSAMRAKELTQQLVMFARGGAPIRRRTQLNAIIREAATFVMSGSNVTCEFSLPADSWEVDVDEGQFRQVINNIVFNAVQSMPEGGKIEVRAENVELMANFLAPLLPGNYVKVTIRDRGTGIAPEHLPKIFDPYFTTRKNARGLGLASAYSVVRKHDGQISVDTTPGKGSTFQIYLPASAKPELIAPAGAEQQILFAQGRILVMDDEEVIQELARQMLEALGFEVEIARDGNEALRKYGEARNVQKPFNVVIMDLTIPEGMGGREAIRRLRELDPAAKAIVSSGYSYDPVMANFRQFGFNGVMPKPYMMEELRRVLQEVMATKPSGTETNSQDRLI